MQITATADDGTRLTLTVNRTEHKSPHSRQVALDSVFYEIRRFLLNHPAPRGGAK